METHDRHGLSIRVTGIERTLVDVLDRPALAGGWEEAWRACEDADLALDFPVLLEYARLLGNATTAAKLGYALEVSRERLAVPAAVLEALHVLAPRQPHPVERGLRAGTRLVPSWNLLVAATGFGEPAGEWDEEEGNEEETLR
ncbi:MAG: type IV toxin-antitoxin system AbiEi family antitoxin domain-containing protein [Janthinobacterium lividum]